MGFFRRKSKKNKVAQSKPSYNSPWAPVPVACHEADTELAHYVASNVVDNSSAATEGIVKYPESNYRNGRDAIQHKFEEDSASPPSPSPSALYTVITSPCSNGIELLNDVDPSKPDAQARDAAIADIESVWSGSMVHGFDVKYTKNDSATARSSVTRELTQAAHTAIAPPARQSLESDHKNDGETNRSWKEYAQVDGINGTEQSPPAAQAQTEGTVTHFDTPTSLQQEAFDPPPTSQERRVNKSKALRTSIFREIVRHRGKSVDNTADSDDHKQASQESETTAPIETADVNNPMTDNVSVMQKSPVMPGRTSRSDCASLNSNVTESNSCDELALENSKSNTRSTGSAPFFETNLSYEAEEGSTHASSCWSCGGLTDDDDDEEEEEEEEEEEDDDNETGTYETATCASKYEIKERFTGDETVGEEDTIVTDKTTTSVNYGDGTKRYDYEHSDPPMTEVAGNEECSDGKSCDNGSEVIEDNDARTYQESLDGSVSESFDGSYDDGTLDGSLNESFDETLDDDVSGCGDDDASEGTMTVDSKAKSGSGWAMWFGFGGNRDDGSLSQSGDTTTRSRQSTQVSIETMDETIDDDSVSEGGDSTVVSSKGGDRRELKRGKSADEAKRTNKAVAHFASRAGNSSSSARQLQSKPILGVPRLKKSWKKLKVSSSSGVAREDKSIASEDTPATASISKDSNKESAPPRGKLKASKAVRGKHREALGKKIENGQRHLFCVKNSGIADFTIRQYAVPVPCAPNHVLIKVEASTVSLKDCINSSPTPSPDRFIPGLHVIGKVHASGASVSTLRVGDRIAALLPDGGGNAKYVSIHVSKAILLPNDACHEDIICLVSNYMTAYQCLKLAKINGARLNHAKVLITNASRPVGQAMVELALQEGAKVYVTARKMHEDHLTKLGAKCFNVKPNKWLPYVEGKMDIVIDNVHNDGYEASYRALKPTGVLVCNTSVATNNGPPPFCNAFDDTSIGTSISSWWNNVRVKFFWSQAVFYDLNESYQSDPETFKNDLHRLIYKLQRGEIKPKVAGRVSLNQVPKAQLLIGKGLPNGTVVCLPWKELDPNQKVKVKSIKVG